MISIAVAGEQGHGKSSVIKFFTDDIPSTHTKKTIIQYAPPNFQKIIEIIKPKKFSYPQIEFDEITIEDKSAPLTKYALNIYDILIFVKFASELQEETLKNEIKFFVENIKNTDISILTKRIEKLTQSLKFKHSENEAAELNSLQHLITLYKNNKGLEYSNLDKISHNAIHTFGLLSFKPINIFINTKYNNLCNKFNKFTIDGLNINVFISDFSFYSDLKKESKENPNIFDEFGVEKIDFSSVLINLLKHSKIVHFYTIVSNDIRAWQITGGTSVKKAAGKIHKDFEKGFISAEVIKAADFVSTNGDIKKLKSAGKIFYVNEEYIVCDEDIITFKFNV